MVPRIMALIRIVIDKNFGIFEILANGWKLDVRMNKCLSDYITSTCKMIGTDGDLFLSQTGNRYLNETLAFLTTNKY